MRWFPRPLLLLPLVVVAIFNLMVFPRSVPVQQPFEWRFNEYLFVSEDYLLNLEATEPDLTLKNVDTGEEISIGEFQKTVLGNYVLTDIFVRHNQVLMFETKGEFRRLAVFITPVEVALSIQSELRPSIEYKWFILTFLLLASVLGSLMVIRDYNSRRN